ncbi:hypothetical protein JXA32_14375 [Candidatus Sumerlaeota bacterium]|nr:hypothetical protein [Candidatus Sumerlaeota bacterium]
MGRHCDYCGGELEPKLQAFTLRISLFAEAGALEFSEEDLEQDHMAQLKAMVEQMQNMSEHQVEEAADEVYEDYQFTLCDKCRKEIHRLMKKRFLRH